MFKWFLNLFSQYANPFERKVGRFFKNIKSTSNPIEVQQNLQKLMQDNLVVLDLFMEKKYKNYKYLKKSVRRQMYTNAEVLNKEFDQHTAGIIDKRKYLEEIMSYLKPGIHYKYEKAANFGKLLKDPTKEPLIGDCNQIVTLYAYLYSRKFPITDLQIKILPEHVCLHFEGKDIEATNGTFQEYKEFEYILPITEIISTNLLDVTDSTEKTGEIDQRTMLKRAQLAYMISSMKDLVTKNLNIAYRNLGIMLMNKGEFDPAIFFAEKLGDQELINTIHRNAAIFYLNKKNFTRASHYANKSGDDKLKTVIIRNQGIIYYNKKNYKKAISYFQQMGDVEMVKACKMGEYSLLAKRIRNVKTVDDAKKYHSTYQHMLELATSAGDEKAAAYVRDVLGKI
jgi:tetratricopeptide (TPR) repeat protein